MSTTAFSDLSVSDIPQDDPAWLVPRRREAIGHFQSFGFPTTKNEDWHFTSPAPITAVAFSPMPAGNASLGVRDIAALLVGDASWPRMIFVNGRYASALSNAGALPRGVQVMSLASALREEPTLLERYLGTLARTDQQAFAFAAINTASIHDGAVLHVAADVAVDRPIHLLYVTDDAGAGGVAYPRTLIVLEPNARAAVIEQYAATGGGRYLTNAVTECVVGDGATLAHYALQRESPDAFHVGHIEVAQGRDSHYVSLSFSTGAQLSRKNIYTSLAGDGCGATLNGLYLLDGTQVCDQQTRIEHVAPNCYSREMYKGILDGASHGVFNGKVFVRPEAQKTDGKQTNNTLLLSERARIDTKPQLEIFADDVKCTHGATVGRLDEVAAFYMKSRGVTADTARKLLTYAFAAQVLETIELEPLKVDLEALVLARYAR